jgi:hypothetical protein
MGALWLLLFAAVASPDAATSPDQPEPPAYYGRSVLETGALLGIGAFWYWRKPSSQAGDWDLKFDWSAWRRKLELDAVRFDSNDFLTNAIRHPVAGTAYFHVARENGLPFFQSYLSSFLASLFWEYFIEVRELPSLNDIIMTPGAGMVIGESTYQLGRAFAAGPPSLGNDLGAWLLSPIRSLNDLVAGRRVIGPGGPLERRVGLQLGSAICDFGGGRREELSLSTAGAVVAQRGYRQPGQGSATVGPGRWSGIALALRLSPQGQPRGLTVRGNSLFGGLYLRRYDQERHGAGLLLGLGGTFDFDVSALRTGWDQVSSVGLLGPTLELTIDRPWLALRLSLSAAYDFALVESLAFALHGPQLVPSSVKAPLRSGSYYYAQGMTSHAGLTMRVRRVELDVSGDLGLFFSLQGRDRFQERLHAEFGLHDSRARASVTLSLAVTRRLRLAGTVERVERRSHLLGWTVAENERRMGVSAALAF